MHDRDTVGEERERIPNHKNQRTKAIDLPIMGASLVCSTVLVYPMMPQLVRIPTTLITCPIVRKRRVRLRARLSEVVRKQMKVKQQDNN